MRMMGEYSWDFWILFELSEKDLVFCEIMEMLNISGIFHNMELTWCYDHSIVLVYMDDILMFTELLG